MKAKRHNCEECSNFIPPVPLEPENLISDISKAGCKAGKRVMFRHGVTKSFDGGYFFNTKIRGYFRYCNNFKENK